MIAALWFIALSLGYQFVTSCEPLYSRSIASAIQRRRIAWMHEMANRDPRIVDAQLLANLTQGSGFFASTTLIISGALATLMGSGHAVQVSLERLPFVAHSSPVLWEVKLILLMSIFVFAFFKFAWAFRLSHYAAIMIGSCPPRSDNNAAQCDHHACATAQLVGIAASHSTKGLRSFYHAIAAVSWFVHPLLFIGTTSYVIIVLIRRDFFSRALQAVSVMPVGAESGGRDAERHDSQSEAVAACDAKAN